MTRNQRLGLLAFLLSFTTIAWTQGGATGAISGTVQDASGAALSGAKIEIISDATGQSVRHGTTDSDGIFTAP